MGVHSLNSPSSFARRIACPGSARMERDLPDQSSVYAAEGTAAHALGEKCLLTGKNAIDFLDQTIEGFNIDHEIVNAVQDYIDYCRPKMRDGVYRIEEKLDLSFLGSGTRGTADFIALSDGVLHVVDYKHGKGVPVDAIGNIQGLCYGLGASMLHKNDDWCSMSITIVQPRAYHDDGPIRKWTVQRDELIDYMMDFAVAAKATEDGAAPLQVGDHCRFCKAKPKCPAHIKFIEEAAGVDLKSDDVSPKGVEFLTDDELSDLFINKIKIIEQWCHAVKDLAQKRAEAGEPLPSTKLVETRATRRWVDEKIVAQKLGHIDGAWKKSLISAPQMEKLLGKEEFAKYGDLVEKRSTGYTVVAESDPRPNARPSGSDEFGPVNIS